MPCHSGWASLGSSEASRARFSGSRRFRCPPKEDQTVCAFLGPTLGKSSISRVKARLSAGLAARRGRVQTSLMCACSKNRTPLIST